MSDIFPASKLGFGCMRLPLMKADDPQSINLEQLKDMVDLFLEAKGSYFDTAFVYHDGYSEKALGKALVRRHPRTSFTLASKCLAWTAPNAASAQSNLTTSLQRLGTDYLDYYLLHNLGSSRTKKFDEYGMWDFVQEKKKQGLIRYLGFSLHDGPEALEAVLSAHPEVDFVQLQVNYLDWEDPIVQSRACMEIARAHAKPVVTMESARGGRLVDLPKEIAALLKRAQPDKSLASWAYRFCYELPDVLAVLSGMSSLDQVRQNVGDYQAYTPFTAAERDALNKAVEALRSQAGIPCTNCRYCVKDCPQQVAIPEIMGLLNLESMTKNTSFARWQYSWQAARGLASSCLACGVCESRCPQGIPLIKHLKTAVEHFEA